MLGSLETLWKEMGLPLESPWSRGFHSPLGTPVWSGGGEKGKDCLRLQGVPGPREKATSALRESLALGKPEVESGGGGHLVAEEFYFWSDHR